jgi:hypothetical protein
LKKDRLQLMEQTLLRSLSFEGQGTLLRSLSFEGQGTNDLNALRIAEGIKY